MHEFVLSGAPAKRELRGEDARHRQAPARLRLSPADDLLPAARRRGADGRADRDRDPRVARLARGGVRGRSSPRPSATRRSCAGALHDARPPPRRGGREPPADRSASRSTERPRWPVAARGRGAGRGAVPRRERGPGEDPQRPAAGAPGSARRGPQQVDQLGGGRGTGRRSRARSSSSIAARSSPSRLGDQQLAARAAGASRAARAGRAPCGRPRSPRGSRRARSRAAECMWIWSVEIG